MLRQKIKGIICCAIIVLVTVVIFGNVEASRRVQRQDIMEKLLIENRKVSLYGKVFDLYIDHNEKSITIYGEVEDWDEEDKVIRYFDLRSPKNYKLVYKIGPILAHIKKIVKNY